MTSDSQLEQFVEALEAGDLETTAALLTMTPGMAVEVLPDGWPVFLLQSVFPRVEIIDLLIEQGADPNVRNPDGETLLHLTGDTEIIRKLIAVGADINALNAQGRTPMMAHAPYPETGRDAIYTLLAEGADPNLIDQDGQTLWSLLPEGPEFAQLRRKLRPAG